MNAVIYARYSSEGQLKDIYTFAKQNNYNIVREPYIDRAKTATNDKRDEFQRMIRDSEKRTFDMVIVWKLDGIFRSRQDGAIYRSILRNNEVNVISVHENISDDASGVLLESILEGLNEWYSRDLSEKVRRGIAMSVEKCKFIGGFIPLGYKVDEHKNYQIDPATAPIVQRAFELYSSGYSLKDINNTVTEQFGKPCFDGNFRNTLNRIFDNKNYLGVYTRGGAEVKGGMPRILTDELFQRVQIMRQKDKNPPAKARHMRNIYLQQSCFAVTTVK